MATQNVPDNAKLRRAETLLRGKEYKVSQFLKLKSKFPDKSGADVFKLVAVYVDFKKLFYTYMSNDFNNKPDEYVDNLNQAISGKKENIRIVFYGRLSQSYELDILMDKDSVDQDKLQSMRLIEESERGIFPDTDGPSPKKMKIDE